MRWARRPVAGWCRRRNARGLDRAGRRYVAAQRTRALLQNRLPLQERIELLFKLFLVEQLAARNAVN
ncbi:MAG TPA: hypothetical protein VLC97_16560, partial [Rhodanobacteraceae bacterium]|nr:hypothetical protein [Rhodanobacteraceae bacterium]